jgi:hypothetical protein
MRCAGRALCSRTRARELAALRGKASTMLPHKPVVWILWSMCGASLLIALAFAPLARVLHIEPLAPREASP